MNRNELEYAIDDLGKFAHALISIRQELREGTPQYFLVDAGAELMYGLHARMENALAEGEEAGKHFDPRVVKG